MDIVKNTVQLATIRCVSKDAYWSLPIGIEVHTGERNIVCVFKSVVKIVFHVSGNIRQTDVISRSGTWSSLIETSVPELYKLRLHTELVCLETVLT